MAIVVNPIPYNPGNVAIGTEYTPDTRNNYITIPNVRISADLKVPSETFTPQYVPEKTGRKISHATAVITESKMETVLGEEYLKMKFLAQVFFTDSTNDLETVEASIKVNKPTDFSTFSIVGPFQPVIENGGVVASYDATETDHINIEIPIIAFELPVTGEASVKVQVATGTFS